MNAPSLKQIDTAQLEDAEPWFVERFLPQLNPFLRDVCAALAGNLTRGENVRGEEREIEFTTGAVVAADTAPFPLKLVPQLAKRPRHVYVTNACLEATPIHAVQPFWELDSSGNVVIHLFTGLDTATRYRIRLMME